MIHELIVYVKRIKEQGLRIVSEVDPGILDLEYGEFRLIEPVSLNMVASLVTKEIILQGEIRTAYQTVCSRCLEKVSGAIHIQDLILVYENTGQDMIDISPEIRDEVILAFPTKVVCDENCQGLCPGCRVNLNQDSCRCPEKPLNNPFSNL